MEEINVTRGCSPHNNEKYCSDGDSTYLTGEFKNVLFRLMGIDAFEISKMNIESRNIAFSFLFRSETCQKKAQLLKVIIEKSKLAMPKDFSGIRDIRLHHAFDSVSVLKGSE